MQEVLAEEDQMRNVRGGIKEGQEYDEEAEVGEIGEVGGEV